MVTYTDNFKELLDIENTLGICGPERNWRINYGEKYTETITE